MGETGRVRRLMRGGVWLAVLAAAVVVPGRASAQLPLGGIINVSANGGDSRQPHMVVDAGGVLHVAWADDTGDPGNYRIRYRSSANHGQSFGPTQVLSDAGSASLRPRMATGSGGLYLVWMQDVADESKDIFFRRSQDGGQSWGPIVNVSQSAADSREGRIAVGPNGTIYVVWDEVGGGIALARSFDEGGSFEPPRVGAAGGLFDISMSRNCTPGEPTGACTPYPGIAVDPATGRVYIVWHDGPGTSFSIRFSRSTDGGNNWSPFQTLSSGAFHSHCAAITVGPTGRVLIAYEFRKQQDPHRHDSMLVQSTNGGASFTAPLNLSNGPGFAFSDYPWPAEAPNGMIAVGWEDNTRGGELNAVVAVSTDGGGSFSPNEDISNNDTSTSTEIVTLFGPDGTLYVLWEDYQNGQAETFLRVAVGLGAGGGGSGHRTRFDFDGDGKADLGVYRRSTGEWLIFKSASGFSGPFQFGSPALGDIPVAADFDGDGKTDVAVFRQASGDWLVFGTAIGFIGPITLGAPGLGDMPVPADYDGDGKADLAVYRRTTAEWFIFGSATGFNGAVVLGSPGLGDMPVAEDYDGDGRADLAVYRPGTAEWFVFGSSTGFNGSVVLGCPSCGDVPVPADYDGDGRVDLGVYRPSTAEWLIFGSATGFGGPVPLGSPALGDVAVPADYDGDGKTDLAVFRTTTGEWFIFGSATGFGGPVALGAPALGDTPLQAR